MTDRGQPTNDTVRPRSGGSARSSSLTLLGEFVLPSGGGVWTSTLVEALGLLGYGEQNARQATARLLDQGLLERATHGRRTRWTLSDAGQRLLTDGAQRIYGFQSVAEPWDGRWLLVLSSVPDTQRAIRHQLRRRLGFLGFGTLSGGVMVSPHTDREPAAIGVFQDLDLDAGTFLLKAEATTLTSPDQILAAAWDVPALADRYKHFTHHFSDLTRVPSGDDSAAFVAVGRSGRLLAALPLRGPRDPGRTPGQRVARARGQGLFRRPPSSLESVRPALVVHPRSRLRPLTNPVLPDGSVESDAYIRQKG